MREIVFRHIFSHVVVIIFGIETKLTFLCAMANFLPLSVSPLKH